MEDNREVAGIFSYVIAILTVWSCWSIPIVDGITYDFAIWYLIIIMSITFLGICFLNDKHITIEYIYLPGFKTLHLIAVWSGMAWLVYHEFYQIVLAYSVLTLLHIIRQQIAKKKRIHNIFK